MLFLPARLELMDPLALPPSPVAEGCAMLLPDPLAPISTGAPATGLPKASRAVTVTMLASPVLTVAGEAVSLDRDAATTSEATGRLDSPQR
jgi:hypothetical protein